MSYTKPDDLQVKASFFCKKIKLFLYRLVTNAKNLNIKQILKSIIEGKILNCKTDNGSLLSNILKSCSDVNDFKRLKYLGYDRACGLVSFLKNQAKNGSAGAKLLMENVQFLVDIFHVSIHTDEVCMSPDDPNCLYHPHLANFEEIRV